jgi:hypothetical protein
MTTFLLHPTKSWVTIVGIDLVRPLSVWSTFTSGRCLTDVCNAKEKAALAFVRGVGGDRAGSGYNVRADSEAKVSDLKVLKTQDRPDRATNELISLIYPS